jgi:aldose sugar dehydrogenase
MTSRLRAAFILTSFVLIPLPGQDRVLGTRPPDVPAVPGQPLEQREPNGKGQKPAFSGQTRAVAVVTKTPIRTEVIAQGLNRPWGFAFLPDGKFLITEKSGKMRIVDPKGNIGGEIAGVPKVVTGVDAGLLDVALSPGFTSDHKIFFTYCEPRDGNTNGVSVASARLSADQTALEELKVIYRVEPGYGGRAHYGSRILFNTDGTLFVSVGDRYDIPLRIHSQELSSPLGKILRLNPDGSPAAGNPFAGQKGALPEIWAIGVRNPQGLTFQPATGDVWESEHGTQGGDEINIIVKGQNYGWPVIAYGTNYDGTAISTGETAKEGMRQPVYYWDPTIAPSGITFYSADLIPEWKGNLFVAGLAGQHVSRLVIQNQKVVGEERLLLDQHQRIRKVAQGPDGALWAITDNPEGRLIRMAPPK